MKPKKCKYCKDIFTPFKPLQYVCSPQCALDYAKVSREKKQRLESRLIRKETKEKLKTRSDWMKEAQTSFNAWIRERDKDLPCISCQRYHDGQYHAGHYRTTKAAPELRFEEMNVHKQCSVCNNHLSGNILEYRINLIKRIGQANVNWLEGSHKPKKYTIDELKAIKEKYKNKLREIA